MNAMLALTLIALAVVATIAIVILVGVKMTRDDEVDADEQPPARHARIQSR